MKNAFTHIHGHHIYYPLIDLKLLLFQYNINPFIILTNLYPSYFINNYTNLSEFHILNSCNIRIVAMIKLMVHLFTISNLN